MKARLRRMRVPVAAVVAACSVASAALGAAPYFERVGAEAGLRAETVTALFQDRAGFVWVGSRNGLTMYDGYRATIFEHDASDPGSISDNSIRTIYQDRRGDLWIGTNTGGLDRLDLAKRRFEHFRRDDGDPHSLSHDSVYAIVEDASGALWVGTQRGLNRLDRGTGKFERFLAEPGRAGALGGEYVSCLLLDSTGKLWVGTLGGGISRFDAASGGFVVYRRRAGDPASLHDDEVLVLGESRDGTIVVGTSSSLELLDPSAGTFRRVSTAEAESPALLVTSLAPGSDGRMWVGTYGAGLYEADTGRATADAVRSAASGDVGANAVVTNLLNDRDGTLWIGTWGQGVFRLRPSARLFAERSPFGGALPAADVTAAGLDAAGRLWVGTALGETFREDGGRGSWRRIWGPSDSSVYALAPASADAMWIGTNKSLIRVDSEGRRLAYFEHRAEDPASLGPGFVKAVAQSRDGRLWVGTGEGGLQELDTAGRVVARHLPRANDPRSLSDEYVTAILEDARGTLWVGTRSGGLNAFDPRSGKCVRFVPQPRKPQSLSHHYVTAILEDSAGTIWVATAGGGVNRVVHPEVPGDAGFERLTTADGLIDNNVMGILEDGPRLWLSTKRGLSCFEPKPRSFRSFTTADGLPSLEFESGVAVRSRDALWFGSLKGLVGVPAGATLPARASSPIVVTSIRTPGAEFAQAAPSWSLSEVEIPYGRWISFELAVLDFDAEHKHSYGYRVGGARSAWIDLGPQREITFTDLAPGSYTFEARGRADQADWTEIAPRIALRVVPPFWRTGWFRGLALAALAAMAFVVHRMRLTALERRNRELTERNERDERARRELASAYDRLRLLARRLEVAKEEERKSIARELHDELGPALTAVVINLQLLKTGSDANRSASRIAETVEIVDRMVQRIRDLSLDLRPPLLDEMGLVSALRGYLETQSERSGVAFDVRGATTVAGLPPEVEIVAFRVIQEAVTNVLRHSGARRAVVTIARNGTWLEVAVEDDGRGFDVRSTLDGPATGRILGLLGMQERVRMLDGEFEIRSAPGAGTTVKARLPGEEPA